MDQLEDCKTSASVRDFRLEILLGIGSILQAFLQNGINLKVT